ncbi:MAG: hypothetical protein WCJ58_07960 [bacterium]
MKNKITLIDFIKGTILSFILGFLATIPWILLATFTSFFVGFLGYLIGLAAYKGFVIGAGKAHKAAIFVIIPVILLAIPFSEIISFLLINRLDGFTFTFTGFLHYLFLPFILKQLLINISIGYFIAFLGAFGLIRNIFKYGALPTQDNSVAQTIPEIKPEPAPRSSNHSEEV